MASYQRERKKMMPHLSKNKEDGEPKFGPLLFLEESRTDLGDKLDEEYNEGDDSQEVEVHVVLVREIHYLHTKASPSKKPGKNPPWRTFFLRRLTLRKQKEIQKPDCNYHLK